jgi:hypothetical protein
MELRQSSLVSSILPSNQTRWKFESFENRAVDVVLCSRMFESFFSILFPFHSHVSSLFCCLYYHKKTKLSTRYLLITDERQKSEKKDAIYCFFLSFYDHLKCFSPSIVAIIKCIKVKFRRIYIRTNIKRILLLHIVLMLNS